MSDERVLPAPDTGILFYQTEDVRYRIQVRLQDGTVWLNQRLLAELYQVAVPTINIHISTIFSDHELVPEATIRKYLIVQTEGSRQIERQVDFYNLDMILAIGYRVRSHRGVQFRRWATERLKEYIVKGFVMDDERLKGESAFGRDYFDELLERIRDIRASEKRFYQKVRDIYTLSVDYDSKAESTQEFFKINKLHWAITGQTAAELISGQLEERQGSPGGCGRGQKLPATGRYRTAQPPSEYVAGLCRGPGRTQKARLHEGLAREAGCIPAIQPEGNFGTQWAHLYGRCQALSH